MKINVYLSEKFPGIKRESLTGRLEAVRNCKVMTHIATKFSVEGFSYY